MSEKITIAVILLAAGSSKRMGTVNKLHLPINGRPLIRHMATVYRTCFHSVLVVTGFEKERTENALDRLDVDFVDNPDYAQGQQSSVRKGIEALLAQNMSGCDAVLIALADQPLLTEDDLLRFSEFFCNSPRDKILIPYYKGQRGNPVLCPMPIFSALKQGSSILTCRHFIDKYPELTARYSVSHDHFTTDIDTIEDAHKRLGLSLT